MNLEAAISEPLSKHIAFHNLFNRNVKLSFGSLQLATRLPVEASKLLVLPTGNEPWGSDTKWRNLEETAKSTAIFLAEMSIVRATAAWEHYLIGATAELSRASASGISEAAPSDTDRVAGSEIPFIRFADQINIERSKITKLIRMENFFTTARNCIVHRSNYASKNLEEQYNDAEFRGILEEWPKRTGKWKLSLPLIETGKLVDWRPRHAIMASYVYYRCAVVLDKALLAILGPAGLTRMAAHHVFFALPPISCNARLNPETMVRSVLCDRYKAKETSLVATIEHLRALGWWDRVRSAFHARFPEGPETARAIRGRNRDRRRVSR